MDKLAIENTSKPLKIFKYASFEISESIISNNCLRFTNPKNFNDPFDCNFEAVYFDVSKELDPKVASEINILKTMFADNTLTNELLSKAYSESQKTKKDSCAVCCFSLNNKDNLMWAHYGNNHKGMCLEFDNSLPSENNFVDVRIDLEGLVNYDITHKINYCANKLEGMRNIYLNKSNSWNYESEYRLLILNDEGIYHYKPSFLSSIILGLRTTEDEQKRIIRVCQRLQLNHVKIYATKIKNGDLSYSRL